MFQKPDHMFQNYSEMLINDSIIASVLHTGTHASKVTSNSQYYLSFSYWRTKKKGNKTVCNGCRNISSELQLGNTTLILVHDEDSLEFYFMQQI